MDINEMKMKLHKIIHTIKPDIKLNDDMNDVNLFGPAINCSVLDVIYTLIQIKNIFGVDINDTFVDDIQETTCNNLLNAIINAKKEG